jgi:hypothetical protein
LDIKNPNVAEEEQQYSSGELIDLLDSSFRRSQNLLQQLKAEF